MKSNFLTKDEYLADKEVQLFIAWLREVVQGTRSIDFQYNAKPEKKWSLLSDVLPCYSWPYATNNGPKQAKHDWTFPEDALFKLDANSSLEENNEVLKRLQNGLRRAFDDAKADLAPWIASIFSWGGVYTGTKLGGGNKGWLQGLTETRLRAILTKTKAALLLNDDALGPIIPDLRFNSGLTKVYSLLLNDFIIYDSRVAAALAWLVLLWQRSVNPNRPIQPGLAFQCMNAKEYKSKVNPKPPKLRNPDWCQFSYLSTDPYAHAKWNLRANWILRAVWPHDVASKDGATKTAFYSLRDIEAALFTMGYDLQHEVNRHATP